MEDSQVKFDWRHTASRFKPFVGTHGAWSFGNFWMSFSVRFWKKSCTKWTGSLMTPTSILTSTPPFLHLSCHLSLHSYTAPPLTSPFSCLMYILISFLLLSFPLTFSSISFPYCSFIPFLPPSFLPYAIPFCPVASFLHLGICFFFALSSYTQCHLLFHLPSFPPPLAVVVSSPRNSPQIWSHWCHSWSPLCQIRISSSAHTTQTQDANRWKVPTHEDRVGLWLLLTSPFLVSFPGPTYTYFHPPLLPGLLPSIFIIFIFLFVLLTTSLPLLSFS